MIMTSRLDGPNPAIELLIPWYHLGQFTTHDRVGDLRSTRYNQSLTIVWDAHVMEDISPKGFVAAHQAMFGHIREDGTGYNDWVDPMCSVVHIYVSGGEWNDNDIGRYNLPKPEFQARCMNVLLALTEGMDERASGDDSYFDYVPSEYDACLLIAHHFDSIFTTEEFTNVMRRVWDGIRGEGEEPIEFIDTYGERP